MSPVLRASRVRVLDDRDLAEVTAILDADPVTNVFVSSRVYACGLDQYRLGAQLCGYDTGHGLESLCYFGANVVPIAAGREAIEAFAERARAQGRRCSSIVGPAGMVREFWRLVRPAWGEPRAIRAVQPVMATSTPPEVPADPAVRPVTMADFDIVYPACVAMFTEEVGVPPDAGDGGALYQARVAELIRAGRAYARIEGDTVVFKAEIGAVTPYACQIQGVWVPPELRGRRHAVHGMAAVVRSALRSVAPTVTLYVNDYNVPARAAYRRVGFVDAGTFTSILF